MSPRYYEDFAIGDTFESKTASLSEDEIVAFAQMYDPQPFHTSPEAASETIFGGLIASGFQTLGLCFRLYYDTGVIRQCSMGGTGMAPLQWLRPVRPGDTLRAIGTVTEMRTSESRQDRGYMTVRLDGYNQDGETVLTTALYHVVKRRPE